ncbi:MAG: hypothetical protein AB8B97_23450 [Granulosicoccus sp.]
MVDGTLLPDSQASVSSPDDENTVLIPVLSGNELLSDSIDSNLPIENIDPTDTAIADPATDIPETSITTGNPGSLVDCQQTLPCRWISADSQFFVTVTNADNIGAQGRLAIEYSVMTSHDSEISIASAEAAMDDTGIRYEPSALMLGEGIGGRIQGVLGGSTILARIEFDRASNSSMLTNWTIGLSDAGLVRQPQFTGLPIGPATNQHADCANTLPCAWVSPTGDVTITLNSVTGFGSTNRLSVNFKIETTRNAMVAVDIGSTAVGTDGLRFTGRTHAIGVETGATKITTNSVAGAHVAGSVFFSRTQAMSPALQHLALVVYEEQPVPRWNPTFLSIPIQ